MTSITFFFFLIPILAILLLAINFIFATHSPYQEKNSVFECGFHSFLGQNRMQFNISFYIFGLLFLLFDLEILLIYPYPVSAQFNSLYGLCIMLIFFLILTLGFAFELGKNALKIDSRQYDDNNLAYKSNTILEAKLINSKVFFYYIILPIFLYIYIQMCIFSPIGLAGPEEQPIDAEYLKDLIYTVQELIKENGLDVPNRLLDSDQHLAKVEAQQYIRGCIRDLNELREQAINDLVQTSEIDWAIDKAKRTVESLSENTEQVSNKESKKS